MDFYFGSDISSSSETGSTGQPRMRSTTFSPTPQSPPSYTVTNVTPSYNVFTFPHPASAPQWQLNTIPQGSTPYGNFSAAETTAPPMNQLQNIQPLAFGGSYLGDIPDITFQSPEASYREHNQTSSPWPSYQGSVGDFTGEPATNYPPAPSFPHQTWIGEGRNEPWYPNSTPTAGAMALSPPLEPSGTIYSSENPLFPPDYPLSDTPPRTTDPVNPNYTSILPRCKKRGGRIPGSHLSNEKAAGAKQMRKDNACWHCRFMKKKCSQGDECEPCRAIKDRGGFRIFTLPCDRGDLQSRSGILLPDFLISNLDKTKVEALVQKTYMYRPNNRRFPLFYTINYGGRIKIEVFQFTPPTADSDWARSVSVDINPGSGTSEPAKRQSLYFSTDVTNNNLPKLKKEISKLVKNIISNELRGWAAFCYRNNHSRLQMGVLYSACLFVMDTSSTASTDLSNERKTLRRALKLSILFYIMSHQVVVAPGQISHPLLDGEHWPVCPPITNKAVKMSLVPRIKALMQKTLEGLNKSLKHPNGDKKLWGFVFCTVILLLIVTGENEVSVYEVQACAILRGGSSQPQSIADEHMEKIENDVADVLIGLFKGRFQSPHKFNPFKDEKLVDEPTKRLIGNLRMVFSTTPEFSEPPKSLGDIPANKLATSNVPRILRKFIQPFL